MSTIIKIDPNWITSRSYARSKICYRNAIDGNGISYRQTGTARISCSEGDHIFSGCIKLHSRVLGRTGCRIHIGGYTSEIPAPGKRSGSGGSTVKRNGERSASDFGLIVMETTGTAH